MSEKKKKEPRLYILCGKEYPMREITFEVLCQDVAYRKDIEARDFIIKNQDGNYLTLRKEYLTKWGTKAPSKKEKAIGLLNW